MVALPFKVHLLQRPGRRPGRMLPDKRRKQGRDVAAVMRSHLGDLLHGVDAAHARPDLVTRQLLDRMDLLYTIATKASHTGDDLTRRCAARIQMCLADASGQWIDLLREVHRHYPRPIVAWLHARYARHLALSGDGAGAQEHYLEAIERACTERCSTRQRTGSTPGARCWPDMTTP
jgi:hypothetical protein